MTNIWSPPSLSELTPYYISLGLTHLGLEASICDTEACCKIIVSICDGWKRCKLNLFCNSFCKSKITSFYLMKEIMLNMKEYKCLWYIWRPPSLSELTLTISNMELTHLCSEASICITTYVWTYFFNYLCTHHFKKG